jgi:hypothetical protein
LAAHFVLPDHPSPGGERAWLVDVARRLRAELVAHPGTAEHLLAVGPTGDATRFVERVSRVLADAGVAEGEVRLAYGVFTTLVTSLALQQVAIARRTGPTLTTDLDALFAFAVERALDGLLRPADRSGRRPG